MSERQLVMGLHSVRTALKHGKDKVYELLTDRQRRDRKLQEIIDQARSAGVRVRRVEREELDRLAEGGNHQGAAAWIEGAAARNEAQLAALLDALGHPPLLLILDQVQDPHNLGACLRSADGAGADAVIVPKDRAAGLTPVACKVASGAAESVPFFQVTNLARTLKGLARRGVFLIGAAGEAEQSLYDTDLTGPIALVLGAEEKGLRRLTREACDQLAALPMRGVAESLNVSVSAGILLFEAVRQRRLSG